MNNKIELTDAQKSLLAEMKYYNEELGEFYNIGNIRGIGITTALLEFCKSKGYNLIVANRHTQTRLMDACGYEGIWYPSNMRNILDGEKCIVDVGVDLDYIRKNCNIVGGVIDLNGYNKYGSSLKNNKNKSNLQLIDILNKEVNCLLNKIEKAREGENSGTYKNLIQSLAMIMELRNKESKDDWELMYSEYKTEVSGDNQGNINYQKQVAVWEQNGDGLIRNHRVWNVQDNTFYTKSSDNLQDWSDIINGKITKSDKIKIPCDSILKEVVRAIFKDMNLDLKYVNYNIPNNIVIPKDLIVSHEDINTYLGLISRICYECGCNLQCGDNGIFISK